MTTDIIITNGELYHNKVVGVEIDIETWLDDTSFRGVVAVETDTDGAKEYHGEMTWNWFEDEYGFVFKTEPANYPGLENDLDALAADINKNTNEPGGNLFNLTELCEALETTYALITKDGEHVTTQLVQREPVSSHKESYAPAEWELNHAHVPRITHIRDAGGKEHELTEEEGIRLAEEFAEKIEQY